MAFDPQAYLAANPDVAASGMSAEYHYNNFGQYEGRDPGGATSGAQSNFWDAPAWQSANPGGTSASGIQSANFQAPDLSNLPNTPYFQAPYQFEGRTGAIRLDQYQMQQVADAVARGEDYNTMVLRMSGDGIGTGSRYAGEGENSYVVPYDYDVATGRMVQGGTAGGASYSVGPDGKLTLSPGVQSRPAVGVGGSSQSYGGSGVGAASGTGGQSGNGLVQGVNVNQYDQNPYLSQMGTVLTNRVVDNLNRNVMPGIRSNAVAAGGFGGSRQGVVEANAMKDANQTISDALTGAYFQDFTNQMNRNLAQYGQNQNFFSNQRGQDLQQLALGANLFQQGNQGWLSQGQGLLGLGQTQQQAPWQVINNANAGLGQWSGYGTTTSANQGGGAQGVLGGSLAGGQLGKLWGGAGLGQMTNSQIEQSWGLSG